MKKERLSPHVSYLEATRSEIAKEKGGAMIQTQSN